MCEGIAETGLLGGIIALLEVFPFVGIIIGLLDWLSKSWGKLGESRVPHLPPTLD